MKESQSDYSELVLLREQITNQILSEDYDKKIILAGPGTGKSFLFQKICERNIAEGKNKNLVLTFINELVDDLSRDLHNLADVKTLHSFALSLIPGKRHIFIRLGEIIGEDYYILNNVKLDYSNILCNMLDEKENLEFYSQRRKYYDYFSSDCSIFTLIKLFENHLIKIPSYSQILIDEYQDFNKLESTLIGYLAQNSPILIVGDDDQSLYKFKYADPDDIRSKYLSDEFKAYNLPYCSRCTKVIIDAFQKVITNAQSEGYLKSRIIKEFKYFPTPDKDAVSDRNQKIIVKKEVFHTQIIYRIAGEIQRILDPRDKNLPSILIICTLRKQIEPIEKALKKKGFKNVDASQKYQNNLLIEGINLVLDNSRSNLGWRIIFKYLCDKASDEERFRNVLKDCISTNKPFYKLVTVDEIRDIRKIISSSRKIKESKVIAEEEQDLVYEFLGYNPRQLAQKAMKIDLERDKIEKQLYKNIPIKIVTILGSKGLTTDYSFLINFDDKYLLDRSPSGNLIISDVSICNFLVAITRAKIKTHIFTSQRNLPIYLQWIGTELIEEQ